MNDRCPIVGSCPICEQGRCRVRVCTTDEHATYGCVVCDECEATWFDPTLGERFQQPSPELPVCPKCNVQLWGQNSRWADEVDLCLLGWYSKLIFDN
jgi:hypothetical protein